MTGSSFDAVIRAYGCSSLGLNVSPLVKLHGLVRGSVVHLQLFNNDHCLTVDRHVQVQGGSYCIILDKATISELGLKKGSKIHVKFSKGERMKVNYVIRYHTTNGYDGSDFPDDKQEFEDKMSFRKSEGWESIGHISRDGLHVEILFMEVRN